MPEPQTLLVKAGPHDRHYAFVEFSLPQPSESALELVTQNNEILPVQLLEQNRYVFCLPFLGAGQTEVLLLRPVQLPQSQTSPHVQIAVQDSAAIDVRIGESLLTTYHYKHAPARPYFHPLRSASGQEVTRAFPMRTDTPNENHDHPHHRSLWIAFGDVDGTDNWSEAPDHGFTIHNSIEDLQNGDVFGRFKTHSVWTDSSRLPLLDEYLTVTAWASAPNCRLMDFNIRLTAAYNDITFGDTKEGGILSVRVAAELDVPRGGKIENSFGGIDEAETWGKSAHWCDYSGTVGGSAQGIAVMDHPHSFRYPTHWHVRNYGLMTANPFGYGAYTNGLKDGSHILKQGDSIEFHYRLLLHSGNAQEGQVRAKYLDWVSPPTAELVPSN